ncbi:MAG: D-alanine--D-alanine ligase family protein [Prolixibacteraceae bacterium]
MQIIIIFNKDLDNVITKFGVQNQELYSEKAIDKMKSVFEKNGFEVELLDGNLNMFEKLRNINNRKDRIPFVFNRSYGIQGENRYSHIPSIFEMLGIPYFGSGPFGHTLALDKIISKEIMRAHNIPTPDFRQFRSEKDLEQEMEFPVIIKPSMEAGSIGMKIVNNREELKEYFEAQETVFSQYLLIEKFIRGREFVLGMMGNGDELECFPLIEIELDEGPDTVQTKDGKIYAPKEKHEAKDIPPETIKRIEDDAKKLFNLLRLRDYARADLRMDEEGNYYFLEINSMASLSDRASYTVTAKAAGYNYDELIMKLFEVAVQKYFNKNQKLQVRYESILENNRR